MSAAPGITRNHPESTWHRCRVRTPSASHLASTPVGGCRGGGGSSCRAVGLSEVEAKNRCQVGSPGQRDRTSLTGSPRQLATPRRGIRGRLPGQGSVGLVGSRRERSGAGSCGSYLPAAGSTLGIGSSYREKGEEGGAWSADLRPRPPWMGRWVKRSCFWGRRSQPGPRTISRRTTRHPLHSCGFLRPVQSLSNEAEPGSIGGSR